MQPSKSKLKELLDKQKGKLTSTQISAMFKCFGNNCSRWNSGTYKCELGLCDDNKEAFDKYFDKGVESEGRKI